MDSSHIGEASCKVNPLRIAKSPALPDICNSPQTQGSKVRPAEKQDIDSSHVGEAARKVNPLRIEKSPKLPEICNSPQTQVSKIQAAERLDVDGTLIGESAQTGCELLLPHCVAKSPTLCCKEDKDRVNFLQFRGNQHSSKSDTYTVVGRAACPDRETSCPHCGGGTRSERCVNQALYAASTLSSRDKPLALRSLSRFLVDHLGSELSVHLCSLVDSAFHAGEDFSSVNRQLDQSCTSYLPVIFQLLLLSGSVE